MLIKSVGANTRDVMKVNTNAGFRTDTVRDAVLGFLDGCRAEAGAKPTLQATRVKSLIDNVCIDLRCGPDKLPKPLHDLYLEATAHERAGARFGYLVAGLEHTAMSAIN